MLLPLLLTVRCTGVNSMSPSRAIAGLHFPVLGADSTLFQVVFQIILETFSLTTLVSLPIAQFSIKDLLGKPGRGHTYNMTGPTKLVLDKDGLDACDIGLFQNTAVGSSILPFNVEYTTETWLMIVLQAFEMVTVGSPRF